MFLSFFLLSDFDDQNLVGFIYIQSPDVFMLYVYVKVARLAKSII